MGGDAGALRDFMSDDVAGGSGDAMRLLQAALKFEKCRLLFMVHTI